MNKLILLIFFLILFSSKITYSQIVPSTYENIQYLMTFGKEASPKWGDDDNTQVHFFVLPKSEKKAFYIRIFDPSISGSCDTKNGSFDTKTTFSFYGGKGAFSTKAARLINPVEGYDNGKLLSKKTFGSDKEYDNKWYSIGPFNPQEGEYSKQFDGYIFKIICKGISGNDGNAYKYSLSYKKNENIAIENGNIFTYEMCFKLFPKKSSIAHVYPFITDNIKSILINNFDADDDIFIRITSIAHKLINGKVSLDGNWNKTLLKILSKEINTSIDVQLVKKTDSNNDMMIFILNQFKEAMPLFTVPIGGKPKYLYKVNVKYKF